MRTNGLLRRHVALSGILLALGQALPAQQAARDTLFPQKSELGNIWRTVLVQYAGGKLLTEADLVKQTSDRMGASVGKWRKGRPPRGGPPRVLSLNVNDSVVIDTAWAAQLVADSVLDGYCSDQEFQHCPGEYVTLFLRLGLPTAAPRGEVKVLVTERAVSPKRCLETPGTFWGFMEKQMWLGKPDSLWTFLGHEMVHAGSGFCRGR